MARQQTVAQTPSKSCHVGLNWHFTRKVHSDPADTFCWTYLSSIGYVRKSLTFVAADDAAASIAIKENTENAVEKKNLYLPFLIDLMEMCLRAFPIADADTEASGLEQRLEMHCKIARLPVCQQRQPHSSLIIFIDIIK